MAIFTNGFDSIQDLYDDFYASYDLFIAAADNVVDSHSEIDLVPEEELNHYADWADQLCEMFNYLEEKYIPFETNYQKYITRTIFDMVLVSPMKVLTEK